MTVEQAQFIVVTGRTDPAEEGGFVSYCPELEVASQGESIDEAIENLKDAIATFIETLLELGDWQDFLNKHNLEVLYEPPSGHSKKVEIAPGETISALVAVMTAGRVAV